MTRKPTRTKAAPKQIIGSKTYYQHGLNPTILYTEGVHHFAETADVFWLVSEIAILQVFRHISDIAFQRWTLTINPDQSATLVCMDRMNTVVCRKHIKCVDAPQETITLLCVSNCIMLPSMKQRESNSTSRSTT